MSTDGYSRPLEAGVKRDFREAMSYGDVYVGQIALGHFGAPADIAHAVVYLAGAGAGYITGETLHVNGGMYMP